MSNWSRAYNAKDTTGFSKPQEKSEPRKSKVPVEKFKVDDHVDVVDNRTSVTVWSGVIVSVSKVNGLLMVRALNSKDKYNRPLCARFGNAGHAVGRHNPLDRHLRACVSKPKSDIL